MAATHNITIDQGATFSLPLVFKDASNVAINLTDVTFAAQIRPSADSKTILASFTVTKDPLTTGRAVLSLTDEQTGALTFGTAVYDLLGTKAGVKTRYIQGTVTLSPQVTR